MIRTTRALVAIAVATIFTLGGATAAHAERPNGGRHSEPNLSSSPGYADSVPGLSAARAEADYEATVTYLHALAVQAVADLIVANEHAEEAAREAAARIPDSGIQHSGATWPHSDAWWHGVAICEQGGRNDPYFGYFSFMDGSQGGKPWAEQVAAGNALLARAGREVGPWAASCVAAGYAASPGG